MKPVYYRQCEIKNKDLVSVAWIPEKFAVVGKFMKINDVDGWLVSRVYSKLPSEHVLEHERDYLHAFPSLI